MRIITSIELRDFWPKRRAATFLQWLADEGVNINNCIEVRLVNGDTYDVHSLVRDESGRPIPDTAAPGRVLTVWETGRHMRTPCPEPISAG